MRPLVLFLFVLVTLSGCKKEKAGFCGDEYINPEFLKGAWEDHNYLLDGSITFYESPIEKHSFHFIGKDSFTLELSRYKDYTSSLDTCDTSSLIYEYITGKYTINRNRLFLEGHYTDHAFSEKNTACGKTGKYDGEYTINFCSDTLFLGKIKPVPLFPQYRYVKMYRK